MRIGFLSLPFSGHLNPMTALARKLQARGNDVVFISVPDAEPVLRAAGLKFVPFCEEEYPIGSIAGHWSSVAKLHGEEVLRHSSRELLPGVCKAALEHLPKKIAETGVEALVFDKIYFYLELVAMSMGIPYGMSGLCCMSTFLDIHRAAFSAGRMKPLQKLSREMPEDSK